MKWIKKNGLHILALLLIAGATWWCYYAFTHYNKVEQGPLGDAFNGMAGPVISLASSVLIYFSFLQQVKANQIQYDGLRKTIRQNIELKNNDILEAKIQRAKKEIDVFEVYSDINSDAIYTGVDAVNFVAQHLHKKIAFGDKVEFRVVNHLSSVGAVLNVLHEVVYMMHNVKLSKVHRYFLSIELRYIFTKTFFDDLDALIRFCEHQIAEKKKIPLDEWNKFDADVMRYYNQIENFNTGCRPFIFAYYAYQQKYKCDMWYDLNNYNQISTTQKETPTPMSKQDPVRPWLVFMFMSLYLVLLIGLFVKGKYEVIKDLFMPATLLVITVPIFIYKWKLKQINDHPSNAAEKSRAKEEHDNVELFAIGVGFFAGIIGVIAAFMYFLK